MQTLLTDLRYGLRIMRRNPGFTAAVVIILALGIGANTTIFSVVNALVFRPLPYPDPDRLVFISEGNERLKFWGAASYPNFEDWRSRNQVLERMAIIAPDGMNVSVGGEPQRISGVRVSRDLIPLLGAVPALGRTFLPREHAPGAPRVAMLSHACWTRRFGGAADITQQNLNIDGVPHAIVGILPPEFRLGYLAGFEPELWTPLISDRGRDRGARFFNVFARLKPGVSTERAEADLNVVALHLAEQYPETNAGWKVHVSTLRSAVDPAAYALLAILICSVLGIVCTNVTNLLLARAAGREKELTLRAALGADRMRLGRQLFSEGLLLASSGTGLGVLVAFLACRAMRAGAEGTNLELLDVRPDVRVLGATVLLFIATATAVAFLPALRLSRIDLSQNLRDGMSAAAGMPRRRFRSILIAAEIMLSFVLLVGAGLVIKSWFRLWQVDLGHRVENILTMNISLPKARYSQQARQAAFFEKLLSRLESRGELHSAGLTSALPTWGPRIPLTIPGRARPQPGEEWLAGQYVTSPRYFGTMNIVPKAGRLFTQEDTAASLPVAVINQALARRFWEGRNPIGEEIEIAGRRRTIVGVIGDLRSVPLHVKPMPEVWVPFQQAPSGTMLLAVQSKTEDPLRISAAIKQEVQALDPDQPVDRIRTMNQVRMRDMGVIQTGTRLLGILALGTVLLASIGIYGVLSQSVSRRSAEFGIRMALGARRVDVLAMVLREGLSVTLLGLLPGMLASVALGKVLSSSLYGIRPMEPLILLSLVLLILFIALLACAIPARRATCVDPVVALRCQ